MKFFKIFILSIIFLFSLEANDNGDYKNYVKELLNYKTKLPKHLVNPFVVKEPVQTISKKVIKTKKHLKIIKKVVKKKKAKKKIAELFLMAIFNDKVLVELGNTKKTKWIGINDRIDAYVLKTILNNDTILVNVSGNEKIIKMKENNITIKVTQ